MTKWEPCISGNLRLFLVCNQRAISTVLTTLIILVASIVLGIAVTVYGTSLFQTGAQQESIEIKGVILWVNGTNSSGIAWGAAAVRNTGDKLVSVDTIQIRGTTIPYTNWYVDTDQVRVSVENFQSQFNNTDNDVNGDMKDSEDSGGLITTACASDTTNDATTIELDLDGAGTKPTLCLLQASGPISLTPGQREIVYFKLPYGILSPVDSGSSVSVSIFAGKTGAPTSVTVGNP